MNNIHIKKAFLAGIFNTNSLENSYSLAAEKLGLEVLNFDVIAEVNKYVRAGKTGKVLHRFFPVQAWTQKMNRDVVISALKFKPDIFIYFTTAKVLFGTIATLKTINPNLKVIWVWPDTPLNMQEHNYAISQLVDITATYSKSTINVFEQLRFKNIHWVPLAGDNLTHYKPVIENNDFKCDISFVGRWDIKRERVLKIISNNFRNVNIDIHGPLWKKKVTDKILKNNIKGNGFYGEALAVSFNRSRININQIDDTNFPAANMRFFEIPTAGGLELTSSCPEMENEFLHKKHLLYYKNENEMLENIQWILDHPEESTEIRKNGQQLLLSNHTYIHRLEMILKKI